ncbi:alanyl-tRNA synthetase [Nematocida displodere]|uniref:Alanine--tRNA ligase n=1 Tax=Nematocida displodere TaxID=1805483 RepID=A0A177EIT3_9MICR|nr:alanyl-tRNA synthetase [Nematocida displodere]
MWTAEQLRKEFVEFFEKNKHTHWKSSSVLPDDTSLLFTNSGMVQFKKKFLDLAQKETVYGQLTRACNYQKCIRAGGKHNDLDDVGKDTYHHTFFEMLGNWSFGDYFKEEAIAMAWTFLTEVLGLEGERLYVSYFEGDASQNLPEDSETKELWGKSVPQNRILPFGAKENFWEMGNTGPCGPCTEIHYDRVGGRDASALVNQDDPDVIEIWNVVFIQYNREEDQSLSVLPKKHVDTGMGLERVLSILEDKRSNYATEVFQDLFAKIEAEMGVPAYGDTLTSKVDTAYRVIADHSRTLAIALMDGILPTHDGRGYVIRRILRRALGFQYLHMKKTPGLLPELVRMSFERFSQVYATDAKIERAVEIVTEEEAQFTKTLSKGLQILTGQIEHLKSTSQKTLSGENTFILYDRYGFPIDLTAAVCEQEGIQVDSQGFQEEQKKAKLLSKGAGKQGDTLFLTVHDLFALDKATGCTPTEDCHKYTGGGVSSRVIGIKVPGELIDTEMAKSGQVWGGEECGIVLEKTSFYGEAGGQEGDHGRIILLPENPEKTGTNPLDLSGLTVAPASFTVSETKKSGMYVLHQGQLHGKLLPFGQCAVDMERRRKLAIAHTSTHILNFALVNALPGDSEPRQCGSLVSECKLRFDFAWPRALTPKEIDAVERQMNDLVAKKEAVVVKHLPYAQALGIPGLRHMKDEEYPETVRVVQVGERVLEIEPETNPETKPETKPEHSVELCGGTHVTSTAQIERIRIVSESGIARGVRRIVAFCEKEAKTAEEKAEALLGTPLTDTSSLNEARALFDSLELPLAETIQIREKLEAFQKDLTRERREHFEKELERLKKTASETEGFILFESLVCQDLASSLVNKMIAPLVQHLEKTQREGAILYYAPDTTLVYGALPNATETIKNILSGSPDLKVGGKGSKAMGNTTAARDVVHLAFKKYLAGL